MQRIIHHIKGEAGLLRLHVLAITKHIADVRSLPPGNHSQPLSPLDPTTQRDLQLGEAMDPGVITFYYAETTYPVLLPAAASPTQWYGWWSDFLPPLFLISKERGRINVLHL